MRAPHTKQSTHLRYEIAKLLSYHQGIKSITMDNEGSRNNPAFSRMYSLEARIKSFKNTAVIDGKKFRWPYTVIPYEGMARLGFFYQPYKDTNGGDEICRDAVQCVFCRQVTHDFKDCRSKKKDMIETMTNVLQHHMDANERSCLLSDMKLQALRDVSVELSSVNWKETAVFCNPMSQEAVGVRTFTFESNWHLKGDNLSPQNMSEAGLLRYDSSYTGFEELTEGDVSDACYCIYCKSILGSWQTDDDPILEHYKSCNGGNCFFFEFMRSNHQDDSIIRNLQEKFGITNAESVDETVSLMKDRASPSPHTEEMDAKMDPKDTHDLPSEDEGKEEVLSPPRSPVRKKRLLRKSATKRYFEEENSYYSEAGVDEDKDLVVEFREHVEKARSLGRKNRILDDSNDEFSFSAQGHSTFEIPAMPSFLPSNNFDGVNEDTDEHEENLPSEIASSLEPSKELVDSKSVNRPRLNDLPIDGPLSPDTSLKSSVASTPIHSPKDVVGKKSRSDTEGIEQLRHLQSRKIC